MPRLQLISLVLTAIRDVSKVDGIIQISRRLGWSDHRIFLRWQSRASSLDQFQPTALAEFCLACAA